MKKFGLLLILVSVMGFSFASEKLTEDDIYAMKNPYIANVEYLRFEYCKNGLIPFRSIANTAEKELKESLGFYEFDKEDLKYAQTRVIQFAVKLGKKYNGDEIDSVIGYYWAECLDMPLKYFENDQTDEEELENEDLDSLL
ncbi:MAG: hypothetical protein HRU38_06195 [Saccharospirillaceae bacterium]|nr:hypothetical protein [Pseudomonadales bacterium]NRB78249.1 hypothetical protein [Saccharospirillaceae bacterium]